MSVTATVHGIEKLMVTGVGMRTAAYPCDMASIPHVSTPASTTTDTTSAAGGGPSSSSASTVVST